MRSSVGLAAASLLLSLAVPSLAASAFDFYDRGPYRNGVPRPAEILGYEPGTFHTNYGNMERYIDALVRAAGDRVVREPFGRTYEFRERAVLILSSPENIKRLDAIREATAKLADPRKLAGADPERLIQTTPATVWLNYSIHGDESASFEAMMQVAYQLAAGEDQATRDILDHCVVLLNLAHNPDGHERFVTWINALGSGNPDPWAIEQQRQQPWGIGGRTNHYQVDLNRDALAMSQVESRQMGREFARWNPQVFADHHGQTASYFFAPPALPINPALSAAEVAKWTDIFGRANAAAFDRYGWNYFVRDVFDLYYPGYWDSWPSLHGAVGMTYETDGGGNLAIRRDDETVVTLLDGIQRHFTASLATAGAAAAHRQERLRDFQRFARDAIEEGRRGDERAYVIDPGKDPQRAAALAEDLMHTGVEVRWVEGPLRAGPARAVWTEPPAGARLPAAGQGAAAKSSDKPEKAEKSGATKEAVKAGPPPRVGTPREPEPPWVAREFPNGAYVIDLAQPAGRLARTLIERDAPVDSAFARAQLDKYERNLHRGRRAPKEGYDFYDVTAWSLPVTYGVRAYAVRALPAGGVLLAPPDPTRDAADERRLPDSVAIGVPMPARISRPGPLALTGADGRPVRDLTGRIEGGRATTAYVWDCSTDGALALALRLMQEDFKIATSTRPLRAAGRDFPRGSFIARVERNPERLHDRIADLARATGTNVTATNSAYIDRGDTGIGSEAIASLKRPRVAMLVDGSVSNTSFGWLWFLFERRLGLRFTAFRVSALAGSEIDRYNVIIIPDGSPGALVRALGEGGISTLKDWISRGGTLICLDDAAEFPTLKSVGLSSARAVGVKPPSDKKDDADDDKAPADSVSEDERRPEYIPGTIFWASLDPQHFLGYGFGATRIPVLLQGRLFLKPSKEGWNPIKFDRAPLTLTGWTWPETERRLSGTAYAVDEPNGGGHVIMIEGSPAFRLFWRSTERLLLNAVIYAPTLD